LKILHTADWHVGQQLRGRSRAEEHRQVLGEIVAIAGEEAVDIILVAGDLFDASAPAAESEEIVYGALLNLAATGAEVVLIAGNHDHPRRLQAVAPILDRLNIRSAAEVLRPQEGGMISVRSKRGERACLALIPFISKRTAVRASHLMSLEVDELQPRYSDQCKRIITKLCEAMPTDSVNLAVAHLSVEGGAIGGGERQAHTVFDYYVPHHVFPDHLSYVALGHLHAPQRINAGMPMWYSGAPLQLDFGERDVENCVLIVDAHPGVPAEVRRRPLRSGRKLKQIRGTLAGLSAQAEDLGDAYLKVILAESGRVGLADEVREVFPNAVDVIVEQPEREEAQSRADMEQMSPRDLFRAFLEDTNQFEETVQHTFELLMEEVDAPA
jgi:exonuclease SbcD